MQQSSIRRAPGNALPHNRDEATLHLAPPAADVAASPGESGAQLLSSAALRAAWCTAESVAEFRRRRAYFGSVWTRR